MFCESCSPVTCTVSALACWLWTARSTRNETGRNFEAQPTTKVVNLMELYMLKAESLPHLRPQQKELAYTLWTSVWLLWHSYTLYYTARENCYRRKQEMSTGHNQSTMVSALLTLVNIYKSSYYTVNFLALIAHVHTWCIIGYNKLLIGFTTDTKWPREQT